MNRQRSTMIQCTANRLFAERGTLVLVSVKSCYDAFAGFAFFLSSRAEDDDDGVSLFMRMDAN